MYQASKRIFDCVIAFAVGIAVSPIMVLVALLLWFEERRVIFRQIRPGLHGRLFTLYKFCSMNDTRDEQGVLLPDEQRLTKIGAILRKLSLDELPQFLNVLKGDMSLVGPRPLLVEYLALYTPEQGRRHEVKPGITGWAQVQGRNTLNWEEKFSLDVWYVEQASFSLDLKILWLTLFRVISCTGISSYDHATIQKFSGNKNASR